MSTVRATVQAVDTPAQEHLIWLRVPAAGNDGMLLGAVESKKAAEAIADSLNRLFKMLPIQPGSK